MEKINEQNQNWQNVTFAERRDTLRSDEAIKLISRQQFNTRPITFITEFWDDRFDMLMALEDHFQKYLNNAKKQQNPLVRNAAFVGTRVI